MSGGVAFAIKPHMERAPHMCYRGIGAVLEWPQTMAHLNGPRPPEYDYLVPTAVVCAILCMCVSLPCIFRLATRLYGSAADSIRWPAVFMIVVATAPCGIALLKLLVVVAPRIWKILFLLAAIYEVLAFWCFKKLVFSFIGKDDEEILAKFAEAHATKMWAAPPIACCFRRCVSERHASAGDIQLIRILLTQFMIICPLMAAIEMTEELSHHVHKVVGRIEVLSLVLAMYALFALLIAVHDILPNHRLHAKFWTIKGVFIASTAVFRMFCETVVDDVRVGERCYTSEAIAAAQAGTVTGIIAVGLSVLAWYSFQPEDIDGKHE